eukprot:4933943-Amphidinium_carterae.5
MDQAQERERSEEEIGSRDFINMINFSGRNFDSFQLEDQDMSDSENQRRVKCTDGIIVSLKSQEFKTELTKEHFKTAM